MRGGRRRWRGCGATGARENSGWTPCPAGPAGRKVDSPQRRKNAKMAERSISSLRLRVFAVCLIRAMDPMSSGDGAPPCPIPRVSPRRKPGSIHAGLWNMGPGFRRGDSEWGLSSEGPYVQWEGPRAKLAEQPYAWVRNCDLCFFESEEQPRVKEVNGAVLGASGSGRRAAPFRMGGYTMSKIDRRGFWLRRTAFGVSRER
jgi:hypothetical protein